MKVPVPSIPVPSILLRLIRRCRDYCRQDPRLWPVLESDDTYRDYLNYLTALNHWSTRS